jgi:hypothetical protein
MVCVSWMWLVVLAATVIPLAMLGLWLLVSLLNGKGFWN